MPCGHVPIHHFRTHLTPGLADSVRRVFVRSRAVFSRASRMYVLCRGVVCRVSSTGVRSWPAAGAWDVVWARTIWYVWSNYHSKFFAPSTGILHGAPGGECNLPCQTSSR